MFVIINERRTQLRTGRITASSTANTTGTYHFIVVNIKYNDIENVDTDGNETEKRPTSNKNDRITWRGTGIAAAASTNDYVYSSSCQHRTR